MMLVYFVLCISLLNAILLLIFLLTRIMYRYCTYYFFISCLRRKFWLRNDSANRLKIYHLFDQFYVLGIFDDTIFCILFKNHLITLTPIYIVNKNTSENSSTLIYRINLRTFNSIKITCVINSL